MQFKIIPGIGLIYLCNPNNPTSILLNHQQILKLLPTYVVISEANAEFTEGTNIAKDMSEKLIVIRSFSKAYGIAGLRVGYMVSHPQTIKYIKERISRFRVSSIALKAALAAISDQEHLERSVQYIKQEKNILMHGMRKCGFNVIDSDANTFIASHFKEEIYAKDLIQIFKSYGILVVSCAIYPGLERFIRIAPNTNSINNKFLQIIKEINYEKL